MTTRTYTEVPCVYCGQTGWHACNLGVDTTTSVLPVPAPEQQGEPVCARCGLPGDIYDHSTGYKYHHTYHDFEPPTPPPSEEAEARPLRPARNVTAWTDESYRELEEERDRLREERDAARRSDMRSTAAAVEQLHRAEAAEAQVAELRSYHAGCDERFDGYERRHAQDQAQVQKLRAALANFVNAWDEDMPLDGVGESIDQYLRPALAAHQEEGETAASSETEGETK